VAASAAELFVRALYQDVLGRAADAGGLNGWVQALQQGVPREVIARGFWESAEHRGEQVDQFYETFLHRHAEPAGQAAWVRAFLNGASETDVERGIIGSPEYQAAHAGAVSYLTALYADVLGRAADPAGEMAWQEALQAGVSRDAVARGFLTSTENDLRLIDRYYADFLGRPAEASGKQGWLSVFEQGANGEALLAEGILASDEFFARAQKLPG
jgi:hypothetical protein